MKFTPSKRYRHPRDTEFKRNPLSHLILDAVRAALERPAHPDSSRQFKARQRDKERNQARVEKGRVIMVQPDLPVVCLPRKSRS